MPAISRFLIILLILISSCKGTMPRNTAPPAGLSIAILGQEQSKYLDASVELRGEYLGYQHADCSFPEGIRTMQIGRSDWVFRDKTGCCFVTGTLPSGLNPSSGEAVKIILRAVVRSRDSKIYLELQSADGVQKIME